MTPSLKDQAREFAIGIMENLAKVLPRGDLGLELLIDENEEKFSLSCNDPKGLELHIDGQVVMRLEIDYKLIGDRTNKWLKVQSSSFALVPERKGVAFFRYDYNSDYQNAPKAHINVHAERDDFIQALVSRGKTKTAKARRKSFVETGKIPRLSDFHFPVGGERFRPSLEEVLGVVIEEFGLDRREETWKKALIDGRERYLQSQLSAAIRDDPDTAAKAMERLGYTVTKDKQK